MISCKKENMKKSQLIKLVLLAISIIAISSCVSKKKKKCDTCPTWGAIEVEN